MNGDLALIFESTIRLAVPLLFVALGELLAERAGTLNISVEGMTLGAAFGAAVGSSATGSPWFGLLVGIASAGVVAALQAELSHRITVNQFVVGLTLNLLVLGVTGFLVESMDLNPKTFGVISVPVLSHLPLVGEALFSGPILLYVAYALLPATGWILYRSRWGLELRSVGDAPAAAQASGVPVNLRRRQVIYLLGLYAGCAGAYLSIGVIGSFTPNMTAGRGYIAIAAVIFGGWTIRGTLLGCLLFGGADALRLALPAIGMTVNSQLLIAAPYLLAIVAMCAVARGARQPKALGVAFEGRPG